MPCTLREHDQEVAYVIRSIESALPPARTQVGRVALFECPNPECRRASIHASAAFGFAIASQGSGEVSLQHEKTAGGRYLVPDGGGVYPKLAECVPAHIREDFDEGHAVREISPKAAAALARRALQSMIRDFWKIEKATLNLEISELQAHVDADTWAAIDGIRKLGNIGAHFMDRAGVILEVDEDEAQVLLKLIEDLAQEWYVLREERKKRKAHVATLASTKFPPKPQQPPAKAP